MTTVLRHVLSGLCLLIFLSGCAILPSRTPLSEQENLMARKSFKEMVAKQRQCKSSVDASITVTLDSIFYSGTMSGYLQAKAPASTKIVGINPLGQPLVVLVSDGHVFNYALLSELLLYHGTVNSESFRRFAPSGFDPGNIFYSLTGKLKPGEVRILEVSDDRQKRGTWIEIEDIEDNVRSLVLFDQERQLILHHLQFNEDDEVVMKTSYADYYPGTCGLPGLVTINSNNHSGELLIRLNDWRTDTPFSPAEFKLELPPSFKRVKVN